MSSRKDRLVLIFPKHGAGKSVKDCSPPPLGLMTVAAYVHKQLPHFEIEIYDGNMVSEDFLIEKSDAAYVGLSTWFSNYNNTVHLAKAIKATHPDTKIIVGGPHCSGLSNRILRNQPNFDFVVNGDGEVAFARLLSNADLYSIPGLVFRDKDKIHRNPPDFTLPLQDVPHVTLDFLRSPFQWPKNQKISAHSAFPISKYRGCFRAQRCEYCSIPVEKQRTSAPELFWQQIQILHDQDVDYFFETADIFPVQELDSLINTKPTGLDDVALRMYLHPGMVSKPKAEKLAAIGTRNVFIGIENIRYFPEVSHERIVSVRNHGRGFTVNKLFSDIDLLFKHGITVMPSLVLGLPGETPESLDDNIRLASLLADHSGVREINVSPLIVLPGTPYFDQSIRNPRIADAYYSQTGEDLKETDSINFPLLSSLFVEEYSTVKSSEISKKIKLFIQSAPARVAHWGIKAPSLRPSPRSNTPEKAVHQEVLA